ncbi:MAG: uroporphyrinogen-III synthase [Burkholderiales bacterium]|nr:uroporphyrinogen-III synthase [Burkholderiales bacterium]
MRLLVTRPIEQAEPAVAELRAHGVDAHALPLIGIEALPQAPQGEGGAQPSAALRRCWATLADRRLVMFVSANAVMHFFAAAGGAAWPPQALAGSTGPGTTAALLAAGVPPARVREPGPEAGRLDSEALWQRLRDLDWRGSKVLIVRGEGGRDWLADTLRAAGAQVEQVAAYRRTLPRLGPAEAALLAAAEADPGGHAWLFSSSEAVHNLPRLAPASAWRASFAFATHPRIGEAARAVGFVHVQVLSPGLPALRQAWSALLQGAAQGGAAEGAPIQSRPL